MTKHPKQTLDFVINQTLAKKYVLKKRVWEVDDLMGTRDYQTEAGAISIAYQDDWERCGSTLTSEDCVQLGGHNTATSTFYVEENMEKLLRDFYAHLWGGLT